MKKALILALAIATPAAAIAESAAEDTAEARRAFYALIGSDMGALAAMAKGEVEYNAEAAQTHANNLATLTAYSPKHLFAAGTSAADLPGKTRAKAEIWSDFAGFMAKGKDYGMAVKALQENAGTLEGLRANLGKVGGTCKACHMDYRHKDF